ncbi:MAG: molybdenum cofactor biosynthesis protein MoaE [Deltaproteobacteria bacterium]|nr:molybdenum cofactor biosynthesis protein MoaE [Deltaproteobacteria bacterium]
MIAKLFGAVREAAGAKELSLTLSEGAVARDVWALLLDEHPSIAPFADRLAVSVNLEIRSLDAELHDGDEIAFLPPVSGGAGSCSLSQGPIDVGEVIARVSGPGMGGIVSFIGAVRNRARGRDIRHLEYESYPEMAEREMDRIAREAAERWPGTRVAIAHRAGHLEIGDIAVVVVAAAPHRGEAFEACRYAIDTLKECVPIWKKEVATDGEYWVDDRP